jgi:hypothetical protein
MVGPGDGWRGTGLGWGPVGLRRMRFVPWGSGQPCDSCGWAVARLPLRAQKAPELHWDRPQHKAPPPIPPHLVYLDLQLELVVLHALQVSVPRLQAAMQVQPHEQRLGAVAPAGHALAVVELQGERRRRVGNLALARGTQAYGAAVGEVQGTGPGEQGPTALSPSPTRTPALFVNPKTEPRAAVLVNRPGGWAGSGPRTCALTTLARYNPYSDVL